MKPKLHNQLVLIILFIVFVTPTILGVLLYSHPQWLQQKTINQGHLLTPAIPLTALETAPPAWRMVVWSPTACEATCITQLEELMRIRLALGRQFYHVRITLLQTTAQASTALNALPIERLVLNAADQQALHAFNDMTWFIADRQRTLILQYPATQAAEAIFHDIKHLLSINQTSEPAHVFNNN